VGVRAVRAARSCERARSCVASEEDRRWAFSSESCAGQKKEEGKKESQLVCMHACHFHSRLPGEGEERKRCEGKKPKRKREQTVVER
jgi:hypothetical protein